LTVREVATAFEELDVSLDERGFEERCQRCGGDRLKRWSDEKTRHAAMPANR
jgi:hypothetical protein